MVRESMFVDGLRKTESKIAPTQKSIGSNRTKYSHVSRDSSEIQSNSEYTISTDWESLVGMRGDNYYICVLKFLNIFAILCRANVYLTHFNSENLLIGGCNKIHLSA